MKQYTESATINGQYFRNGSTTGWPVKTESMTLPSAGVAVVELDETIHPGSTIEATIAGAAAEVVPYSFTPAAGEVAVSRALGLVKYNQGADGAKTLAVTYTPAGTRLTAGKMQAMESEPPEWGDIGGSLSDQTDLQSALNGKAALSHTHSTSDVTGLDSALSGKQPLDSDLTAIAGLATTGLIARTGTGTAAARTITGTGDITVNNGNGVTGNPIIAAGSNLARLNAAQTFSALQTFNLGAVLKGLVFPATELNAHSANVNYQVLASDTMLVLGNNNASYTLNITLPAPVVGKFIWVFNSGALVNAPVFDTGSGSVLFTWAGGGFTQTYNGEQGDHKMTILYCANASRWRAIAL